VANTNLLLNASRSQKETVRNKTLQISGQDADEKYSPLSRCNPTGIKTEVEQHMAIAYSKIDKAVKRGVLHRNNGTRIQPSAETETARSLTAQLLNK